MMMELQNVNLVISHVRIANLIKFV